MSENSEFVVLRNFYKQQLRNQDRVISEHLKSAYRLMREALQSSNDAFLRSHGDTPQNRGLISSTPIDREALKFCQDMMIDVSTTNDDSSGSDGDDEDDDSRENSQPADAPQSTVRLSRSRKRRHSPEERPKRVRSPYPTRVRPRAASFESPLDSIPEWRRVRWYKKKYPKPVNLLSKIERAAFESSSTEDEASLQVPTSSDNDAQPVGLTANRITDEAVSSASSSSALEVNPNVSLDTVSSEECDNEVRNILNMDTLEVNVSSNNNTSALEDGEIVGSASSGGDDDGDVSNGGDDDNDDDRYNLDAPPFHMLDQDDERTLNDMPYVLFCGRCSAPNSIKHIYDKFDQQHENVVMEVNEAPEGQQVQQVQQQREEEVYDIPPNYSQLFPATMPAPRFSFPPPVPSFPPPVPPNSPVNYTTVPPPGSYTPHGSSNAHPQMLLSPMDNFGTPSNNRTQDCFFENVRARLVANDVADDREEGEVFSSDEDWRHVPNFQVLSKLSIKLYFNIFSWLTVNAFWNPVIKFSAEKTIIKFMLTNSN